MFHYINKDWDYQNKISEEPVLQNLHVFVFIIMISAELQMYSFSILFLLNLFKDLIVLVI